MSQVETLKKLEAVLETFLTGIVSIKEKRLYVAEGINRLDEIVHKSHEPENITDNIGEWFATHNKWLNDNNLKPTDFKRINGILSEIRNELRVTPESSPAEMKIKNEIDRWRDAEQSITHKVVLKRGPEISTLTKEPYEDTISLFINKMSDLTGLFKDYADNKKHILSVLDDLINSARIQTNKDALILSAFIIYYLKKNGYKVEPYVKKLKEAETKYKEGSLNA